MNFILKVIAATNELTINFQRLSATTGATMDDQSVDSTKFSLIIDDKTSRLKIDETNNNCQCDSEKKNTVEQISKSDSDECTYSKKRKNLDKNKSEPLRKRPNASIADEENENESTDKLECPVCLQPCVLPVQLSCDHIFCYLCVKGLAERGDLRCALCRKAIPENFLNKPQLVSSAVAFEGINQWFYEGRNGWWQYDDRTSRDIEEAYQKDEPKCEAIIAGFPYIIDLQQNLQFRKDQTGRRRSIKRDLVSIPKKGVAGISKNIL